MCQTTALIDRTPRLQRELLACVVTWDAVGRQARAMTEELEEVGRLMDSEEEDDAAGARDGR